MIYQPHHILKTLEISKMYSVFFYQLSKNFIDRPKGQEMLHFYQLFYIHSGILLLEADGNTLHLKEGDFYIRHPHHSPQILRTNGVTPAQIIIVSFDLNFNDCSFFHDKTFKSTNVEQYYLSNIINVSKSTFQTSYSPPNTMILSTKETAAVGNDQIIANFLELLLLDIYHQNDPNIIETIPKRKNYSDELVLRVIQYIEDDILRKPDINEIAKLTNYSISALSSRFKQATGCSITEYHNLLLIERSKELLEKSKKTINQIAGELNFCNQHYFSTLFKRYTQMTPSDYRAYSRAMLTDPLTEETKKSKSFNQSK